MEAVEPGTPAIPSERHMLGGRAPPAAGGPCRTLGFEDLGWPCPGVPGVPGVRVLTPTLHTGLRFRPAERS